MDPFATRQIRIPIEEINGQEKQGKHYTTDAVNLRYRVISRCSSTSSSGRGRRCSPGRRWRRHLSRRWAAGHTRYLPMSRHRWVPIRYRDGWQWYHFDHTVTIYREVTVATSSCSRTCRALSTSLKQYLCESFPVETKHFTQVLYIILYIYIYDFWEWRKECFKSARTLFSCSFSIYLNVYWFNISMFQHLYLFLKNRKKWINAKINRFLASKRSFTDWFFISLLVTSSSSFELSVSLRSELK